TNALGQLIRVDEPMGISASETTDLGALATPLQATSYKYDVFGKMVQVTQGVQNRYFKYDALGRLLRVSQPEQERNPNLDLSDSYNTSGHWTAGFTYDLLGNVVRATDANGVNIINDYDRAGRVIRRCYTKPNIYTSATTCASIVGTSSESADTPAVTFWYDGKGLDTIQSPNFAKGKLTEVSSSVSTTEYMTFDHLGRLTRSRQITDGVEYGGGADPNYWMTYTYSFSGALTEEQYPSGRKVQNQFESDGDLAIVNSRKNAAAAFKPYVSNFSYTASGGISQMKLGNGRWETAKFNNRMQVTELGLGASASDAGTWKTAYEYGELNSNGTVDSNKNTGNIAKQTLSFNGIAHPLVQSYKFDALYRITEATETANSVANWFQVWDYDRYGNRTSFTQNIGGNPASVNPAIVTATNRFDETGTNFDYDLNGNLVRDGEGRQFKFNGDNKQTVVKDANSNTIGQYFYDGEGKRVKKISNSETTIFVYSSGKLVAEYSSQLSTTPSVSYTTTDHLGTPRIITDAIGQVKSRRDFLPFGEDLFAGVGSRTAANRYSSTTDSIRQKFTGYQKDTETSLDFAEARMYDNRFARFTAVDPLLASGKSANPQTFNRFVYVGNSPLVRIDRDGKDWYFLDGHYRWSTDNRVFDLVIGRPLEIFNRLPVYGWTRVKLDDNGEHRYWVDGKYPGTSSETILRDSPSWSWGETKIVDEAAYNDYLSKLQLVADIGAALNDHREQNDALRSIMDTKTRVVPEAPVLGFVFDRMKSNSSGKPELGDTGRYLGVGNKDIKFQPNGFPMPAATIDSMKPFALPGNGMSVTTRPQMIPPHKKDELFCLSCRYLGPSLQIGMDKKDSNHLFIQPIRPITVFDFSESLRRTQPFWLQIRQEQK
ncbi:MAG TPA: RHS repeat-associated core domain-containing protein, partial [Pyrinomonadaceae bacterium]|nr:RHS repeat-associated core domain-containing protein [Pyrinomonadaceae bacterium]